jgi:hypothetical protein
MVTEGRVKQLERAVGVNSDLAIKKYFRNNYDETTLSAPVI